MQTKHNRLLAKSTEPDRYVPALTGVRALAAYLVFLHHHNPALPGTFANRVLTQGYIGVSVFFVLSGFLIYHRYADDYFGQKNWSWRRYVQNRFARIFPLYIVLLFATFATNLVMGRAMSWSVFVLNITLLKGFSETYKFSGIAQSWSLTVEICFYLLAPYLFVALRRWGVIVLTVSLLSVGILLCAVFWQLPFMLFYTFFGRAFEFLVGMWLARRWQKNQLPTVRFATGIGLFLISVSVLWQSYSPQFLTNPTALIGSEVITYNTVLPITIGLLFVGLFCEESRLKLLLSQPVMQALGRSSYAFYLIHIGVIANALEKLGISNHWLLFGLLVLIAHGLYIFVEKPLYRRFRTELQDWRTF